MLASVVYELSVNFIADTPELVRFDDFRNFCKFVARNHASRRIRRRAQHERFRVFGDRSFDFFRRRNKIRFARIQVNEACIALFGKRLIRNVARFAHDDFIAGIQNGTEHRVHRFRTADRRDDFVFRIVVHAVTRKIARDLFA